MKTFITQGVCAKEIKYKVENNKIIDINFIGGCDGNLKGLSQLCLNMDVDDVIKRLEGISCGRKTTSCPDQLSKALQEYKKGA